jgi:hypothetical protein
LGPSTVS